MDISEIDLESLNFFAKRVAGLTEYRKSLHEYLTNKMHNVAPNLAELVGEQVSLRATTTTSHHHHYHIITMRNLLIRVSFNFHSYFYSLFFSHLFRWARA